jgi:hypothetical protein
MSSTGLRGRIFRLERRIGWDGPCSGCGLPHVGQALGVEYLQDRYAGVAGPTPRTCGCGCCQALLDDLAARYARAVQRESA